MSLSAKALELLDAFFFPLETPPEVLPAFSARVQTFASSSDVMSLASSSPLRAFLQVNVAAALNIPPAFFFAGYLLFVGS